MKNKEKELKDIDFDNKKVFFVKEPTFEYNLDKENLNSLYENENNENDKIKTIIVNNYKIDNDKSLKENIEEILSKEKDKKRIAFYLSENDFYHIDRYGKFLRLAIF